METFSALLAFWAGNSPVTGEFPLQRPVTQSFDVVFDLDWINGWVNDREAGNLRRHRTHYDVTVIVRQHLQTLTPVHWWLYMTETNGKSTAWILMGLCIYGKTSFEVYIMETISYLKYGMMKNNLHETMR